MGYVIALAGKGGTGKTTLAASIVRLIKEKKLGSVLAVDADPNSNLGESLGLQVKETIGKILDDISSHPEKVPSGMSKERFIEYSVQTSVLEGEGFDVLTMGKPEGPGCYCYVNNVLRNIMAKLIKDYDYVVIDNEAGLEHLSRRTTRSADALVIISDASKVGLFSAERINQLSKELNLNIGKRLLVINKYNGGAAGYVIGDPELKLLGSVSYDAGIEEISLNGNSILNLNENALSIATLRKIGDVIWQRN